ncbi:MULTISPECIES: hypothetical protein [unclassified Neisseria]|uniref:hypothetical protein n=1 Tax=unclassified Neisseria TaxID=2623750 RepID=UPI001071FBD0|nr:MULTISPECIES: hypothetical protein [unclassified Neisseria]MBF0804231.1 hypothetical protein [Neisseria sp. 19428wB4_WF04]TFU43023.1 hypothetical protein E4T99_07695 [Neisseria sp. WF04]
MMRKIFLLLNLNLALFVISAIFSIYIIFIDNIYDFKLNLDFLEGLQQGAHIRETNNSASITILLALITFVVNLFTNKILLYLYLKGADRRFFNLFYKKNKILFNLGVWAINPYLAKEKVVNNRSVEFKIFQILFYSGILFLVFCFVFNVESIDLPKHERLISLIINYKIFLFIFNLTLFSITSFMVLGWIFVSILTLISIFSRKEI